MKPNRRSSSVKAAGIVLRAALAVLTAAGSIACEYFDPMDPLSREPRKPDSTVTWERVIKPSLGSAGNGDDVGMCIQQTVDGGYIIAGSMEPDVDQNSDVWLVKTDSFGNMVWDETYGDGEVDKGCYVEQTADRGYIVAGFKGIDRGGGSSDNDLWLIKVKPDDQGEGDIEWQYPFGKNGTDEMGACVRCTDDGGYIITGDKVNETTGYVELWLLKTDGAGTLEWEQPFAGSPSAYGECVSQTMPDLGYVAAGVSWSNSSENAYLIKADPDGNIDAAWDPNPKEFGTPGEQDGACYVQQTSDGGYILAGETGSYGASAIDALLVKLDASGNLDTQWEENPKSLRRPLEPGAHERANCVQQTSDGGYVFTGTAHFRDQDVWLVKTDAAGNLQWDRCFGEGGYEEAESVRETTDGGYILAGRSNSETGGFNLYLVYYKP